MFNPSFRTAQALAFYSIAMTFSGPLPVLIPIVGIYFIAIYWTDKYQILRFYKKPPRFDESVHNLMMRILPLPLLGHILFSVYCYGQEEIFPTKYEEQDDGEAEAAQEGILHTMFLSENGIPMTVTFVLVCLILLTFELVGFY